MYQIAWSWQPGQQDFKVGTPPCPSCLVCHSRESPSLLPQFPGSKELSTCLWPFPPTASQEKCRPQCLTKSQEGHCRNETSGLGPASGCLSTPCASTPPTQCKHTPPPSAQVSSCQQWLPFWAPSSRKEGSSGLTMPLGVMCWLAASQQIPRRALSCHQAGTQSCLVLTA